MLGRSTVSACGLHLDYLSRPMGLHGRGEPHKCVCVIEVSLEAILMQERIIGSVRGRD
jgi:hypothetical protein